jgi:chromosome segregation ATPase
VVATHLVAKQRKLVELRSRAERLESEEAQLRSKGEGARTEADHLWGDETQLLAVLREVSLQVGEVESSLGEANTHLERTNAELL